MFLDTNGADIITNNGSVTFTVNQAIQLPSNLVSKYKLQHKYL